MSEPLVALQPPKASVWQMYRAMVGIGILCGTVIVTVFQLTAPIIAQKRAEALQEAIFTVLEGAATSQSFVLTAEERFEPVTEGAKGGEGAGGTVVHAGYDDTGSLVGLAIEASGMGYQDTIRVLYGYSLAQKAIVGLQVLESKETPGLGDKIETDPGFRQNFSALDVTLDPQGSTPVHPIEVTKHGEKTDPWQIDGITGATISSKAIGDLLRSSTAFWLPLVERSTDDFRKLPAT